MTREKEDDDYDDDNDKRIDRAFVHSHPLSSDDHGGHGTPHPKTRRPQLVFVGSTPASPQSLHLPYKSFVLGVFFGVFYFYFLFAKPYRRGAPAF